MVKNFKPESSFCKDTYTIKGSSVINTNFQNSQQLTQINIQTDPALEQTRNVMRVKKPSTRLLNRSSNKEIEDEGNHDLRQVFAPAERLGTLEQRS